MVTSKNMLKDRLSRYRQITISVIGRKSGRKISIPVWFVAEGDELHLLPVAGSETQWYKNVRQESRRLGLMRGAWRRNFGLRL